MAHRARAAAAAGGGGGGFSPGPAPSRARGRHRPAAVRPGPVAEVAESIDGAVVVKRASARWPRSARAAAAPPGLSPMDTQHGAPSCASWQIESKQI